MSEVVVMVKRVLGDQIWMGVIQPGGGNGIMLNQSTFQLLFGLNPMALFSEGEEVFIKVQAEPVHAVFTTTTDSQT